MKEFANNLYDIIENTAYDLDRYNDELSNHISEFIDESEKHDITERAANALGFIIHKSDDMVFDHAIRLSLDILNVLERKHRLIMTDVNTFTHFRYSNDAMKYMLKLCDEMSNDTEQILHDVSSHENLKDHNEKILSNMKEKSFDDVIECSSSELEHIISECYSKLYNTVYCLHLKIYYNQSKDFAITVFKEILTSLISAANFLHTIVVEG